MLTAFAPIPNPTVFKKKKKKENDRYESDRRRVRAHDAAGVAA